LNPPNGKCEPQSRPLSNSSPPDLSRTRVKYITTAVLFLVADLAKRSAGSSSAQIIPLFHDCTEESVTGSAAIAQARNRLTEAACSTHCAPDLLHPTEEHKLVDCAQFMRRSASPRGAYSLQMHESLEAEKSFGFDRALSQLRSIGWLR